MPGWVLPAAYSLHLLATVVWIGGITFQAVLLLPLAYSISNTQSIRELNGKLRRRFQPLAWLSLAILTGTGLMQITVNPNYAGFLNFTNRWSVAILLKHIAIAGMVTLLACQTWALYPRLSREQLRSSLAPGGSTGIEVGLPQQDRRLVRIHLLLSVIILCLTAIARTA